MHKQVGKLRRRLFLQLSETQFTGLRQWRLLSKFAARWRCVPQIKMTAHYNSQFLSPLLFFPLGSLKTAIIGSKLVLNKSLLFLKDCCFNFLADPGKARGCSTNSLVIHWLIHWFSEPFPPTALRRRHAQTVRDSTSSYKIDYVIVIKNLLNPEGHQNPISELKVTAILLKGWNLPIGGASSGRVCACSLRSRLVYIKLVYQAPMFGW